MSTVARIARETWGGIKTLGVLVVLVVAATLVSRILPDWVQWPLTLGALALTVAYWRRGHAEGWRRRARSPYVARVTDRTDPYQVEIQRGLARSWAQKAASIGESIDTGRTDWRGRPKIAVPRIIGYERTPVGQAFDVQVLPGRSPQDLVKKSDRVSAVLGRPARLTVTDPRTVRVQIIERNPLDDVLPLVRPLPWDGDWSALPFGMSATGAPATIRVRDTSGTVVGGLPGGGKTAGLTTLLSGLVSSPAVQFLIWDGKGGADWSWLAPRAALYNSDDEDRGRVADELEAVVAVMRDRVATMRERRGGSSIWNTGGPSEDMPLLVLVVDECQSYLDASGIPKSDKDAQEARTRTEAALATLVRKGRSAGIWVIPTTQKPTSDSLPTTIGANAASAIAFRVKTSAAEVAVLGSGPGDDDPSATDLPSEPGYAVMATESGSREVVRFAYLPEEHAEEAATASAHLRRDVLGAPAQSDRG